MGRMYVVYVVYVELIPQFGAVEGLVPALCARREGICPRKQHEMSSKEIET